MIVAEIIAEIIFLFFWLGGIIYYVIHNGYTYVKSINREAADMRMKRELNALGIDKAIGNIEDALNGIGVVSISKFDDYTNVYTSYKFDDTLAMYIKDYSLDKNTGYWEFYYYDHHKDEYIVTYCSEDVDMEEF